MTDHGYDLDRVPFRRLHDPKLVAERRRLADVWAEPYDAVADAEYQLAVLDEGHVKLSIIPEQLVEALFALKRAGIDMTGAGPYGTNAFLRGAVVREQRNR
jgi:ATP:corrinoid adenosyltransferase